MQEINSSNFEFIFRKTSYLPVFIYFFKAINTMKTRENSLGFWYVLDRFDRFLWTNLYILNCLKHHSWTVILKRITFIESYGSLFLPHHFYSFLFLILYFFNHFYTYFSAFCRSIIKNMIINLLFPLSAIAYAFSYNRAVYDLFANTVVVYM